MVRFGTGLELVFIVILNLIIESIGVDGLKCGKRRQIITPLGQSIVRKRVKDRGVLGGRVGIQETVLLIAASDKRAWKNTAGFIGENIESQSMTNMF